MQSGGDPIARLWQGRTLFASWQDSSAAHSTQDEATNIPDGNDHLARWKRLNDGHPYIVGVLTDARVAEIAQQLGMSEAWVREQAAQEFGERALEQMMRARNGGGCGGGGRSIPGFDVGPSAGLLGALALIVAWRLVSFKVAVASMLFGIAFPPPPEA
ncbi:MAG: hypothetical protein HY465_01575 [Deltaproteobacteria bacterium]|nr:hypothetical protein [Deltaproteobacteria bacterium]